MKLTSTTAGLALAIGSLAFTTPAAAQYGSAPPAQPSIAAPAPASTAPAKATRKFNISKQAQKEIVELQAAVNAKDVANFPAKLAAAQAKATTADDKYLIAQMQLNVAVEASNEAGIVQALEAMSLSGAPEGNTAIVYANIGKIHYNAKTFDKASAAFERVLQLEPNNTEAMVLLAETRTAQGRTVDGVALIQKAIAVQTAAGRKADESWYKRAIALAYKANLASSPAIAREWVVAYPSPKNWRDAIRIYQTTSKLDDASLLDSMRLAQATGSLSGENDYYRFANTLVTKGFPGEAKTVLEQGFAGNTINKSKPTFSQLYDLATTKSQGDRASLDASATAALAAPDARKAMVTADAYYGYGDYNKAANLYRAALGKSGVDKDLANLRLGMSLARAGDKAGATTALQAAGGTQTEVSKLWLAYLATKA